MDEKNVQVFIIEDSGPPPRFRDQLGIPVTIGEHNFECHPSLPVRVNPNNYQTFIAWLSGSTEIPGWDTLRNEAVGFFDLVLDCDPNETQIETLKSLLELDINEFDKEAAGLFAILTALQNELWQGVLVIASSNTRNNVRNYALKKLKKHFQRDDIEIVIEDNSFTAIELETIQGVVESGINAFVQKMGSLEHRLWPKYTKNWFNGSQLVPHTFAELDTQEKLNECKQNIRDYLKRLLSFDPPEHWFSNGEFENLHFELKHLVGEWSTPQGGDGKKSLTLGNVVLLLAAVQSNHAQMWINDIKWECKTDEILPKQTQSQSIKAVTSLAAFLKEISFSPAPDDRSDDHPRNVPNIVSVNLKPYRLQICLDFDCGISSNKPLIDKMLELADGQTIYTGKTYDRFIRFIVESAKGKDGQREARCVVNLKRKPDGDKFQTFLEVVPCKPEELDKRRVDMPVKEESGL